MARPSDPLLLTRGQASRFGRQVLDATLDHIYDRARATYSDTSSKSYYYRVSASYVTGTHAFKVGFNNAGGFMNTSTHSVQSFSYVFGNGTPNSITQYATPYTTAIDEDADLGLYAQDKWMIDRLTLDASRVHKLAQAVREIAAAPEVLGRVERSETRPNGLVFV